MQQFFKISKMCAGEDKWLKYMETKVHNEQGKD